MAIRTYKITLDTKNSIAPEPVFLRQGDKTGAVVIDATLMDNGSPVSLDGLTPMFKANTADGQAVIADSTGFNIINASGGKFTYQIPSQLGSVDGKIKIAYFSFSDSSGDQSTFDVVFVVEKAADMTKESAKDWASNLNKIIDQYNQWVNNAHSSWQDFVDSNKKIIESIDPGGALLTEIIDARESSAKHTKFSSIGERLDAIEAQPTPSRTKIVDFATISVTYQPDDENSSLTENEFSHLKKMGLNVTAVNMIGVDSLTSSTLNWNETNLRNYLSAIKSEGIEISMLKPHIGVNFSDGTNRADFSPSNTTDWWKNWQSLLDVQAKICIDYEIPILCIGCEFASLTQSANKSNWKTICDFLHEKYPTLKLTYASSGAEFTSRENSDSIFPFLDYIGVNLYPRLTWRTIQGGESEAVDLISEITQGWSYDMNAMKWIEIIDKLSERYQKPVFITETGVMPYPNGLNTFKPDEMTYQDTGDDVNNTQNYLTSALYFDSLIESLCQLDCVKGFSIWHLGFPFNFFKKTQTELSPAEKILQNFKKQGVI